MRGWRVVEREVVGSTNDEARRLAEAGDPGRVAVVAEAQRSGRGRLGRPWVSERGGLYLSALVRPALPAASAGLVPIAAGLAVARALEGLGASPDLRWPNDVLLGRRKVAGVLCEARLEGPRLAWAVVGIGVNVAQAPRDLPAEGATTVASTLGKELRPRDLLEPLLAALDGALGQAEGDPGAVAGLWMERSSMVGEPVELVTATGPLAGLAERVEPTGALVVRTPDGVRRVTDPDLVRVVSQGA